MAESQEADLSVLLGPGHLTTLYQPLIDLRTGACTGFEVLSRWQHRDLGTVPPTQFIPALERAGSIAVLTRVLLAQVFADAASLPEGFGYSVNISPLQLDSTRLCSDLKELSGRFAFDLGRLTIEVTESAIIENLDQARTILGNLKSLGIKLALDDFGTGYSSLTHLNALPFDEIKVDQTFVRNMGDRKDSRKIVAAVIGLGSSLGLITVAEGVEQQFQADMLLRLGCSRGQGWLYGRPFTREGVQTFLASPERLHPRHRTPDDPEAVEQCLEAFPAERYAQLRAIYNGAPVGLCFVDRDLRYVSLNRRLAELNRKPLDAHLGRTLQEVHPVIHAQVEPLLKRALAGEAIQDIEYKLRLTPDAEPQTRLVSYQPAFDEAGEVIGVSVAVVDISERRQAEERLEESEHHYRSMVELNPQIPWTMDTRGRITEVSPRWIEFTGQSEAEALGYGWLDAVHPDDREATRATCARCVRGKDPFQHEFRVGRGDGQWRWVRSRGAPRLGADGRVIRWYGSAECIVLEKQQAEELKASVDRLQAVIDAVPIGIVIAQAPDGRIVSRNPAAQRILQQDPIAFHRVDDYANRVAYFRNGSRLRSHEFPIARAIASGTVTQKEEVYCDFGNGEGKWLLLSGAPVRDARNVIIGAVATIQERSSTIGSAPAPEGTPDEKQTEELLSAFSGKGVPGSTKPLHGADGRPCRVNRSALRYT